jgi:hypothetical protein
MLAREQAELEGRIETFVASLDSTTPTQPSSDSGVTLSHPGASPRREGAEARARWIAGLEHAGVRLKGHGKRFVTFAGANVSIGFANELPGLPNKWFLGAADEPTDIVVLLCRDSRGILNDFVIPIQELGDRWRALARSNGQIKFNVRHDGRTYHLLVPGNAPFEITQYKGRHGLFKGSV